jgi:hypothetical protein
VSDHDRVLDAGEREANNFCVLEDACVPIVAG